MRAQLLPSPAHGTNEAQKGGGIIDGRLVSATETFASEAGWLQHLDLPERAQVTLWVDILVKSAIASGTLFGRWRIAYTMGSRIARLRPVRGSAAETAGAFTILLATKFGIPVSTAHTRHRLDHGGGGDQPAERRTLGGGRSLRRGVVHDDSGGAGDLRPQPALLEHTVRR